MKVEVNVPRRMAYVVLIGLLLGSGMFAFVMAYNKDYTDPAKAKTVAAVEQFGHSPDEIEVNLGTGTGDCSGKQTLQYAIDKKCLGGGTTTMTTGGNLEFQWVDGPKGTACPSGWIATEISDCDSADGHEIAEDSCNNGGVAKVLCARGSGVSTSGAYTNMEVYDIPGIKTWPKTGTVPAGVTKVYVQAWGGGSGSGCISFAGSSGAYGEGIYAVTPGGSAYSVIVGAGGNGCIEGNAGQSASPGGTSSFGSLLTVGSTITGAQNSISPSKGSKDEGGSAPLGGAGGLSCPIGGSSNAHGTAPGGGGGAPCPPSNPGSIVWSGGGAGADGRVIVRW